MGLLCFSQDLSERFERGFCCFRTGFSPLCSELCKLCLRFNIHDQAHSLLEPWTRLFSEAGEGLLLLLHL